MIQLVALTEKPQSKSFGMVAFITLQDGLYKIHGLAPHSQFRGVDFNANSYDQLLLKKQLLELNNIYLEEYFFRNTNMVALWLGEKFINECRKVSMEEPQISSLEVILDYEKIKGKIYIDSSEKIYNYMESWIDIVFSQFLIDEKNQSQLADIMHWTLPVHIKTLAAKWKTSSSPDLELDLQLNMFSDGYNKNQWRDKLTSLLGSKNLKS